MIYEYTHARAHTHALRFGSSDQIAMGYAVILTHPAVPCIFWQVFSSVLQSGSYRVWFRVSFDHAARNTDGATSAVLLCFDCMMMMMMFIAGLERAEPEGDQRHAGRASAHAYQPPKRVDCCARKAGLVCCLRRTCSGHQAGLSRLVPERRLDEANLEAHQCWQALVCMGTRDGLRVS